MRGRGPSTLSLGLLTAVWLTGCALKPVEDPPAVSREGCLAPNPLHGVSSSSPKREVDPEVESLLAQPVGDPRLLQINRQMYQSLRALDAELRREQSVAACEQPALRNPTLEAHAEAATSDGGPASNTTGSGLSAGPVASSAVNNSSAASQAALAAARGATISGGQVSPSRKPSASTNAVGGNGATAPKIVPGSDDDTVARRLRKAAEEETNPTLRAKLWKEYMNYRQGTAVAK
jgi:hypothetical protein